MTTAVDPALSIDGAVYVVRPAYVEATSLDELLHAILSVGDESLFYHTQMPRLRPPPLDRDVAVDDISAWVRGVVQDGETAERVAFAVSGATPRMDELRTELSRVLSDLPESVRRRRDAPEGGEFSFLTYDRVAISRVITAQSESALVEQLLQADDLVWFHHLVERPWLLPAEPSLGTMLRSLNEETLAAVCDASIRGGTCIASVRRHASTLWRRSQLRRRILVSIEAERQQREMDERAVVTRLARRLARRTRRGELA